MSGPSTPLCTHILTSSRPHVLTSSRPHVLTPHSQVKNVMTTTMRKKGIHPEWHEEARVVCNGEEVLVTSGTQPDYNVDLWSGNHPFFQGITTSVVTDEGRVNRFKRRFEGLASLSTVETASEAVARGKEDK